MKAFLRIIFLLFLNFYVAALPQVTVSVWKVYFFPQRTETFFSLIFKWKKCFLLVLFPSTDWNFFKFNLQMEKMFPASRGILRREKKDRKERELGRLPIAMRSIM